LRSTTNARAVLRVACSALLRQEVVVVILQGYNLRSAATGRLQNAKCTRSTVQNGTTPGKKPPMWLIAAMQINEDSVMAAAIWWWLLCTASLPTWIVLNVIESHFAAVSQTPTARSCNRSTTTVVEGHMTYISTEFSWMTDRLYAEQFREGFCIQHRCSCMYSHCVWIASIYTRIASPSTIQIEANMFWKE
jgi:hypothetical protein